MIAYLFALFKFNPANESRKFVFYSETLKTGAFNLLDLHCNQLICALIVMLSYLCFL